MDRVYAMFLQIPGVEAASVTRSQGAVKHYNVRVRTSNRRLAAELERLWPFGVVTADRDGIRADYIVKPNEADLFQKELKSLPLRHTKEVAIIFQLNYPASEKLRRLLSSSVRSGDRLIWSDHRVAVLLQDCDKQVVEAVKTRFERLLSSQDYVYDVSVETDGAAS